LFNLWSGAAAGGHLKDVVGLSVRGPERLQSEGLVGSNHRIGLGQTGHDDLVPVQHDTRELAAGILGAGHVARPLALHEALVQSDHGAPRVDGLVLADELGVTHVDTVLEELRSLLASLSLLVVRLNKQVPGKSTYARQR